MTNGELAIQALRKIGASRDYAEMERIASDALKAIEKMPDKVKIGDLLIDRSKHEVRVRGNKVKFSALEMSLILYFAEHIGHLRNREDILRDVWHGQTVSARTIDAHMVMIRRLLDGSGVQIETVYGAGYRLAVTPC